jgi:hypothetical protein
VNEVLGVVAKGRCVAHQVVVVPINVIT